MDVEGVDLKPSLCIFPRHIVFSLFLALLHVCPSGCVLIVSSTFRCTAAFLAVLARVLVGPLSEGRYPDYVGHLFVFLLVQLPITLLCAVFF